jgi:hypothetical protein
MVIRHRLAADRAGLEAAMTVEFKKRDYSLTGPENARAVAVGLANADWYKTDIARERVGQGRWRRQGLAGDLSGDVRHLFLAPFDPSADVDRSAAHV